MNPAKQRLKSTVSGGSTIPMNMKIWKKVSWILQGSLPMKLDWYNTFGTDSDEVSVRKQGLKDNHAGNIAQDLKKTLWQISRTFEGDRIPSVTCRNLVTLALYSHVHFATDKDMSINSLPFFVLNANIQHSYTSKKRRAVFSMLFATVITARRLPKTTWTGSSRVTVFHQQQLAGRNRDTRTGRIKVIVFQQWHLTGETQGASSENLRTANICSS